MKPGSNEGWRQTRRTLISRLKRWDDTASWQDFFDTYSRLIYATASRTGLRDAEAQDIVQEVLIAVARQMPSFRYDPKIGSFKSWLLRVTQRRIADHWRRHYREPDAAGVAGADISDRASETQAARPVDAVDPAGTADRWEADWEENLAEAALRNVKAQVDPRQYQIFDCYVVKGWPAREVVSALGVTSNQVYLARSRVGRAVKEEVDRLRREMI